jgi:hypothetical protein
LGTAFGGVASTRAVGSFVRVRVSDNALGSMNLVSARAPLSISERTA